MTMNLGFATFVNSVSMGHLKAGWYSAPYCSEAAAIFSGGCSRSGTTLMYSLMNAHSRIAIGLETGLLSGSRNIQGIAWRTNLSEPQVRHLYRQSRCFPEFTEKVLSAIAKRDGKQRWGDKSPGNVKKIGAIFQHFPNAKFIHVLRDGRDVACSLRNYSASFGNKYDQNPWDLCVERWVSWTLLGIAFRGHPNYYEVKYEDLTTDPEKTLQGMFSWLGEEWEPEILGKSRLTEVRSHPQLAQPINTTRSGRWQNDLPREGREFFHGDASKLLIELGYAADDEWITST